MWRLLTPTLATWGRQGKSSGLIFRRNTVRRKVNHCPNFTHLVAGRSEHGFRPPRTNAGLRALLVEASQFGQYTLRQVCNGWESKKIYLLLKDFKSSNMIPDLNNIRMDSLLVS